MHHLIQHSLWPQYTLSEMKKSLFSAKTMTKDHDRLTDTCEWSVQRRRSWRRGWWGCWHPVPASPWPRQPHCDSPCPGQPPAATPSTPAHTHKSCLIQQNHRHGSHDVKVHVGDVFMVLQLYVLIAVFPQLPLPYNPSLTLNLWERRAAG